MIKRILHIDDETAITDLSRISAERNLGIEHTYETSQRADELTPLLRKARGENRPYDVIILDDTTNGTMRGLDALAQVRLAGDNIPIIVYASIRDMDPTTAEKYIKELNADFIQKPGPTALMTKLCEKVNPKTQKKQVSQIMVIPIHLII